MVGNRVGSLALLEAWAGGLELTFRLGGALGVGGTGVGILIHLGSHVLIARGLGGVIGAMDAGSHELLSLGTLDLLVVDTALFLLLLHSGSLVQAVVGAQVEEEDVLGRVDALSLDLS